MSYTEQQRFEASQWFIDIQQSESPSAEVLLRWSRWLEESEGNRLAFEAVGRAWHGIDLQPQTLAPTHEPPYDGSVPVAAWLDRRPRKGTSWRWITALAASVVLAAFAWWGLVGSQRYSSGQFVTATGEHMEVALTDGSRVSLGARTRLTVDFTATERRLRLDTGEAFFEVSKDRNRPFNVHALSGVITAVGTAFNVRALEDRVTVAVTEGVVRVQEPSNGAAASTSTDLPQLRSGEQLTFDAVPSPPRAHSVERSRVDSRQATRWREGWLMYRGEPLRYVIADVARYTDKHVAVSGSVDPQLRFTGAVYRDSVVEWLEALPEVFPVAVHADGEKVIVTAP